MATAASSKSERINIAATPRERHLLEEAARARSTDVGGFLLNTGLAAAEQTLADRRVFTLDDNQWKAFQEALDRPVQNKPALNRLLTEPGLLD